MSEAHHLFPRWRLPVNMVVGSLRILANTLSLSVGGARESPEGQQPSQVPARMCPEMSRGSRKESGGTKWSWEQRESKG